MSNESRAFHSSLITRYSLLSKRLDLHIHTRGQFELHERVDGLRRRLENVEEPLVGPHLELLPRLFVDVRAAQHGVARNLRRQWDRSRYPRAGALGRVDDLGRR